jgi:hypothetical protein
VVLVNELVPVGLAPSVVFVVTDGVADVLPGSSVIHQQDAKDISF